jgi:hypothetical protein
LLVDVLLWSQVADCRKLRNPEGTTALSLLLKKSPLCAPAYRRTAELPAIDPRCGKPHPNILFKGVA